MQIILLANEDSTKLWPLSNNSRSAQSIQLLNKGVSDARESMIQRVVRQIRDSSIPAEVTVTTTINQVDSLVSQLGDKVNIIPQPSERGSFPAICLTCEYLRKVKLCSPDETIIVMPSDSFTEKGYFDCINQMARGIERGDYDLLAMGIEPLYPSITNAYILIKKSISYDGIFKILKFIEPSEISEAEYLINNGAKWSVGTFAFKLNYITSLAQKYVTGYSSADQYLQFDKIPNRNLFYEFGKNSQNKGMVEYHGYWKSLNSWDSFSEELKKNTFGKVIIDGTGENTHVINELDIPMLCVGTKNLIIAASPDGIIITEKNKGENLKPMIEKIKIRPMYEERRWGVYKVIDSVEFPDGFCTLTKRLTLNPGCSISYQRHNYRDEIWTFIDGIGEIVINGNRRNVSRGETIHIPKGSLHTLRAIDTLSIIEIQTGSNLIEEDIERFEYIW